VCAVEINPYAASVLVQRQNDGLLPPFPIWDDIRTFNGGPWRGIVDVVSGGFPCQDISSAGSGKGIAGEHSGLWKEMARIIGEVRPHFVFLENSPILTSRGLGTVLGNLAEMGYDAEWGVLGAADVGAPHIRKRIWVLAYTESNGRIPWCTCDAKRDEDWWKSDRSGFADGAEWWAVEPGVGRVVNGLAARMDRLTAIGNGQVPAVVRLAWNELLRRIVEINEDDRNGT
jgi:DNA (cytosine-5)-methyltransferase 1